MATIPLGLDSPALPGGSLGEFLLERWLPTIERTIRPTTFAAYASHVRCHLLPLLGSVVLLEVDATALNSFYAELLARGLSEGSVRRIHATTHRALRDAMKWGFVERNAAAQADPPNNRGRSLDELRTWNERELRRFLESTQHDSLHPLWVLYAMTGLRRGEGLGLRWIDTDLSSGRLAVRQTFVAIGGEVLRSTPKTPRGRRVVALDSMTVNILRAHRSKNAHADETDLLFASADGGALSPSAITKRFKRLVQDVGLPLIRLHDLRHTHATLALKAGIHPKIVSERLGHSTVAFTLDVYSHSNPDLQEAAAEAIKGLVFGPSSG